MHRSKCLIIVMVLICFEAYYFKRLRCLLMVNQILLYSCLLPSRLLRFAVINIALLTNPLFTYQLSLIYHIAVYRSRNLGFDDSDIGLASDNQSC